MSDNSPAKLEQFNHALTKLLTKTLLRINSRLQAARGNPSLFDEMEKLLPAKVAKLCEEMMTNSRGATSGRDADGDGDSPMMAQVPPTPPAPAPSHAVANREYAAPFMGAIVESEPTMFHAMKVVGEPGDSAVFGVFTKPRSESAA